MHTNEENKWQCRWSPTLGALEEGHQEVWGTDDYTDIERPTVFFGIYGLPDFYVLWRHKGRKCILWAGSDIRHFVNGYWLDATGKIRIDPRGLQGGLASWIDTYCESYVENEVEQKALAFMGIRSKVVPSFLGDVEKFDVSFKPGNKVYTSVSGDDWLVYGWDKIPQLAIDNPKIEFHLYGNKSDFKGTVQITNMFIHGRVPKEQMNAEIAEMQGPLRLTEFDGFSEIVAKGLLMGQYPVSLIEYPHCLKLSEIGEILKKTEPNIEGREYYKRILNKYPWVSDTK